MKMKAAIYTGIEQIAIREVERNEPPPGFVLVDTKTDRHLWQRSAQLFRALGPIA